MAARKSAAKKPARKPAAKKALANGAASGKPRVTAAERAQAARASALARSVRPPSLYASSTLRATSSYTSADQTGMSSIASRRTAGRRAAVHASQSVRSGRAHPAQRTGRRIAAASRRDSRTRVCAVMLRASRPGDRRRPASAESVEKSGGGRAGDLMVRQAHHEVSDRPARVAAPSSACRHLLPQGEKECCGTALLHSSFSPCGRRWREAPDKGGPRAPTRPAYALAPGRQL